MIRKTTLAGIVFVLIVGICTLGAFGQTSEVKEKPRMYSYIANWAVPRAQWTEVEKANPTLEGIFEKALANGTLVGYGNDVNLVHTPEGSTHDTWWSSTSMAGLISVLEQARAAAVATSPVFSSATKHWDHVLVSRYYNWHAGSWKNVYTYGSSYKLKKDAPDDAVDQLSKNVIVPILEKLLADGTIHEYEIDTEAVHTDAPGTFMIFYIAANGEAIDKVNAAIRESFKTNPLGGPAFGSMVDFEPHRDELARTVATYK